MRKLVKKNPESERTASPCTTWNLGSWTPNPAPFWTQRGLVTFSVCGGRRVVGKTTKPGPSSKQGGSGENGGAEKQSGIFCHGCMHYYTNIRTAAIKARCLM